MSSSIDGIHTTFIEYLGRNGTAFARGNGIIEFDHLNAVVHAYTSAETVFSDSRVVAEILGRLKDPNYDTANSWRDHWNNEVGRRIAEWAMEHGYGPDALNRLMWDAYQSGELITSLEDPRIGTELPDPTWHGPSVWDPSVWVRPPTTLRHRRTILVFRTLSASFATGCPIDFRTCCGGWRASRMAPSRPRPN